MVVLTKPRGLWVEKQRGMAISLALNGASFGGIVGVPLLVAAINRFGFAGAMIASALAMVSVTIPIVLIFVGHPPRHSGASVAAAADAASPTQIRSRALRDLG